MSDTRERILAEATKQLSERGYAGFTVAAVRDALGLSSGSMFHAFASKADLAAEVYVRGMADYQTTALGAVDGRSGEDAVSALVAAHLGWVEANPGLARFLYATPPNELATTVRNRLEALNDHFFGVLAEFYASLGTADEEPLDLRVMHALCIGPAQEYCRLWTRSLVAAGPREMTSLFTRAAISALECARPAHASI